MEIRNVFKKIGDTKGIFHTKTGKIKDKNSKDLTEPEEIKKTWKEYAENVQKKLLMTQLTMNMRSLT